MKSPKEIALEKYFLKLIPSGGSSERLARLLVDDDEVQLLQDHANSVSIKRLGYNDHGPVHMRQVAVNAVRMLELLRASGITTSLEAEQIGTYEDSLDAVMLAAFLHDVGMSIGRQDHEILSVIIARPIMERLLVQVFPDEPNRRVIIASTATEGIVGHMANRRIHSLEAGIILIADGCDMEKGRARIPMTINTTPKVGDIHKYSSNAIDSVTIGHGKKRPIRIDVKMSSDVGFFQVEEVLLQKINMSPVKPYIELYASVQDQDVKQYV
ncbi:HD domain-containing protein [Parasphaerochaeta coccoides]|uniref:Metal dependent phosphohydrolase n=1 Tax=Parasphaerochaeta coccoides (strain ATCC BAA-1237 / DSM 17374 / SPN1) TaxID=760011 RepID=F4GIN7_PARC1|nr:HD domain-containing protein [Parasphaerochaeta coccoides]AEC02171.1 metal dependent phosphohydrolase [Parasphaerochaeta coccoides DSM 17374]